ncbi:hypothetical protein BOX15_Mlig027648g1 [Macrostomum lignano]|uniref:Desmoplakin SH3 domain-containing protein n=1 Tax=Macrostomum lignano TaxID=282301 RepID=A0A267DY88_9PLAT|nr:hypothetical protein BOX15_Mlig027648g1 [Macrostomum lignano]
MGTEVEVQLEDALRAIKDEATRVRFGDNNLFLGEAGELQKDLETRLFDIEKQICDGVRGDTEARLLKESESIKGEIHQNKKCVGYLQRIAGLEDDFTKLMHTVMARAKAMRDHPHGDKVTSQGVTDCWSQVQRLTDLTRVHTRNASDYHQFFFDYRDTFLLLKDRWHQLEHWLSAFSPKPIVRETDSIKTFMQSQLSEFLCLWQRVQTVVSASRRVVPVQQRLEPTRQPRPALLLCPFENSIGRFEEGTELTLLDNSDSLLWRVSYESEDGEAASFDVPSIMLWLPPPDLGATELALKLEEKFLSLWGSSAARFQTVLCDYLTLLFRHLSAHDYAEFESPEQWQLLKQEVYNIFGDDDRFRSVLQTLAQLDRRNDPSKRGSRKRVLLKEAEIVQLRSLLAKLESHIKYWESFRRQSLAVRGSEYWLTELDCSKPELHNSIALLETLQASGQEQLESLFAKLNAWRAGQAAEQRRHVRKLRRQEVLMSAHAATGGDTVAGLLQFQLPSQRARQSEFNEAAAAGLRQAGVDEARWSELSSVASSSARESVADNVVGRQWLQQHSRGLQTTQAGTREAALQTTERSVGRRAEHGIQTRIAASQQHHGIQTGFATADSSVTAQRPSAMEHGIQTVGVGGGLLSSAVSQRLVTEHSGSQFDSERADHGVQTRYSTNDTLMLSTRLPATQSGSQYSQVEGREHAIQTMPDSGEASAFFQVATEEQSLSQIDHAIQTSWALKDTALEFSGPRIVEIDLDEDWQTEEKVRAVSQPVDATDSVNWLKRLDTEELRAELQQRLILRDRSCQAGLQTRSRDTDTQFVIFQSNKDSTAVTDSSTQASALTTEGHTQYVLFKSDKDLSVMLEPKMRDAGMQVSRTMTEGQTQYLVFQSDKDLTALMSPKLRDASQQASRVTTESQAQYVLFQSDKDLSALTTSDTRDASLQASTQTREGHAQYLLFQSDKDLNTLLSPVKDASQQASRSTTESQVQYVLFHSDKDLSTLLTPTVRDASLQASSTTQEHQAQYISQQSDKYMSTNLAPTVRDASLQASRTTQEHQAQYISQQSDKYMSTNLAPTVRDASLQASSTTQEHQAQYISQQSDKYMSTNLAPTVRDASLQASSTTQDGQAQYILFKSDKDLTALMTPQLRDASLQASTSRQTADSQAQYILFQSDKDLSTVSTTTVKDATIQAGAKSSDTQTQFVLFRCDASVKPTVDSRDFSAQVESRTADRQAQYVLVQSDKDVSALTTKRTASVSQQASTESRSSQYLLFQASKQLSAFVDSSTAETQARAESSDKETQFLLFSAENLRSTKSATRESETQFVLFESSPELSAKLIGRDAQSQTSSRMNHEYVVFHTPREATAMSAASTVQQTDSEAQYQRYSVDRQDQTTTKTVSDVQTQFIPKLMRDSQGGYCLALNQADALIQGKSVSEAEAQSYLTRMVDGVVVARVSTPATSDFQQQVSESRQQAGGLRDSECQFKLFSSDKQVAHRFTSNVSRETTTDDTSEFEIFQSQPKLTRAQPRLLRDSSGQYFLTSTAQGTNPIAGKLIADSQVQTALQSSEKNIVARVTEETVVPLTGAASQTAFSGEAKSSLCEIYTQYDLLTRDESLAASFGSATAEASTQPRATSDSTAQYVVFRTDKSSATGKPDLRQMAINTEVTLLKDSSGQYFLGSTDGSVVVQGTPVSPGQVVQHLTSSEKNIVVKVRNESAAVKADASGALKDVSSQYLMYSSDKDVGADMVKSSMSSAQKVSSQSMAVFQPALLRDSSGQYYLTSANSNVAVQGVFVTESQARQHLASSEKNIVARVETESRDFSGQTVCIAATRDSSNQSEKTLAEVDTQYMLYTSNKSLEADTPRESPKDESSAVFKSKLMKDSSGQYYLYSCDSNVAMAGRKVTQSEAQMYLTSSDKNIVVRVPEEKSDFSTQTLTLMESSSARKEAELRRSNEQKESQTQYVLFSSDKSLSADLSSDVIVPSRDTADYAVPRLMKDSSGQYYLCSADSSVAVAGTPIAESQVKQHLASSDKNIVARVTADSKDFSTQTDQRSASVRKAESETQSGQPLAEMQTQYALYSSNKSVTVDFSATSEDFSTQTRSSTAESSAVRFPVVMRDNSGQFYLTSEDSSVRVQGQIVTESEAMHQLNTSENNIVARVISKFRDVTSQTAQEDSRRELISSEQQYVLYSSNKSLATADVRSSEEFGTQANLDYSDAAVSQAKLMKDSSGQFYLVSSTAGVAVQGQSLTEAEAQYYLDTSEKNIVARVSDEGKDFSTQTASLARPVKKESGTQSGTNELTDVHAQYDLFSSSKSQTAEFVKSSEDFATQTKMVSVHSAASKPSLLRDSAGQYYLTSQDSAVRVLGKVVTESEARHHLSTSEKSIVARIVGNARDFTTQTVATEEEIVAERQQYELYSATKDLSMLASRSEDFSVQVDGDYVDAGSQYQPKLMRDSSGQYYLSSADSSVIISGKPVTESDAKNYLATSERSIVARVSSDTRDFTVQTHQPQVPDSKQAATQSGSTLSEVNTQYSLYSSNKSITADVHAVKTSEDFATQTKTRLAESTFAQSKLMCDSAGQYYLASADTGMMVRGQVVSETEAQSHLSSSEKSIIAKVVTETRDVTSQTVVESSTSKTRSTRGPLRDVQSEFVLYASDKGLSTDIATGSLWRCSARQLMLKMRALAFSRSVKQPVPWPVLGSWLIPAGSTTSRQQTLPLLFPVLLPLRRRPKRRWRVRIAEL